MLLPSCFRAAKLVVECDNLTLSVFTCKVYYERAHDLRARRYSSDVNCLLRSELVTSDERRKRAAAKRALEIHLSPTPSTLRYE